MPRRGRPICCAVAHNKREAALIGMAFSGSGEPLGSEFTGTCISLLSMTRAFPELTTAPVALLQRHHLREGNRRSVNDSATCEGARRTLPPGRGDAWSSSRRANDAEAPPTSNNTAITSRTSISSRSSSPAHSRRRAEPPISGVYCASGIMLGERSSTARERAIRALLSAFSLSVSAQSLDSRSNLACSSTRSRRSSDAES